MSDSTQRHFSILLFGTVLLCVPAALRAQPSGSARFEIGPDPSLADSLFRLPDQFILSSTDTLLLDSTRQLRRGEEFSINYRFGTIRFTRTLLDSIAGAHAVTVSYRYLPFHFQDSYALQRLVPVPDSSGKETVSIARPATSLSVEDLFGPDLQKSGSIVRGFTVGSNRDLSLNSGLRLQLAGKIASDIDIAASLTDESTPIQPEGTTQTLQEFDKVFVTIRGRDVGATLGDFNLDVAGTEFANLNRKLQGAKGDVTFRPGFGSGSAMVAAAVPRGKYTTNQFTGLEGVQGPYRLVGRNNERNIIVIAGTEQVYIDGERQTRGETNDYVVDYSTGEVTFTTRRLITSASRIVVDFEYTDRQYSRSLLGGNVATGLFQNKATVSFSFFREADAQDDPIDLVLTDSARTILANAGDDSRKAAETGVTHVDSNGYYVRVDTLVGGAPVTFYRYAPSRLAQYNVVFSFVGSGAGDYTKKGIGEFLWVGTGAGDYLPIRYLPLPQEASLFDVGLSAEPVGDLKIAGEFAGSRFDANRFSTIDDNDNQGNALLLTARYAPKRVMIGGANIGALDVSFRHRVVGERFVPLDRTNDIEFGRKWGVDSLRKAREQIDEAHLSYTPDPALTIAGGTGWIERGGDLSTSRVEGNLRFDPANLPHGAYAIENVSTKDLGAAVTGSWLRHHGTIEYTWGHIVPFIRYEGENRRIRSAATGSLSDGSFRFDVFGAGGKLADIGALSLSASWEMRNDDVADSGAMLRQSTSTTEMFQAGVRADNGFGSTLDITLRNKGFSPRFASRGQTDIRTVLVRSQTRYAPFRRALEGDLFYEVSTQQSALLQRVFVRVTQGNGNYIYRGDLNMNGIADEEEFELTRFDGDYIVVTVPSDEFQPVIDLNTSFRLRMHPSYVLSGTGTLTRILNAISTETYVRVEENSTTRDLASIYLLDVSKFRNEGTTIAGSVLFTQDLFVLDGKPEFSARLRYSQRKGLNNFSAGLERNYLRERSLRLRWQLIPEVANQLDVVNKRDQVTSLVSATRTRDITSNGAIFDISYRPEQELELGIRLEGNGSSSAEVTAALNAQSLRVVRAFKGAGQARVEFSREEVVLKGKADTLPFELTGGRPAGKTWLWRGAFDYRITDFVQATVAYDGRSEAGNVPVHTARAEVRAFF